MLTLETMQLPASSCISNKTFLFNGLSAEKVIGIHSFTLQKFFIRVLKGFILFFFLCILFDFFLSQKFEEQLTNDQCVHVIFTFDGKI